MTGIRLDKVSGRGVYVKGNDIDTDRIIPARFLKCVTFDELGPNLFRDERFSPDGAPRDHVLDEPRFAGAQVLISDANFGCGSSREHAPQAIQKFGLNAVIAESFAEIFQGNCTTLGIPCLCMDAASRQHLVSLIEADPEQDIIIDIENLQVICANNRFDITMKDSTREAFLGGSFDPLDTLIANRVRIDEVEASLDFD